ncbi:SMa0974 family conjugal transfer regulator [Rhizobium sp. CF142]|uniref:SMa0974 family conjugal transfer regulator n=1 Tax=Rhizobium sp. CF142 TaxID=1144314 RepID=UPI00026EFD9E|nr:hypothetical protein [Rhizobium sp. CF142]EJJ26174.1 hypothetical protein PMI11_05424 [Rhizobium sp. CF142]
MYKHVAETLVVVAHAPNVAEKICTQIGEFCRSILSEGPDRFLSFEDGCVVILPTDDGLFFRVSAGDLATFHGIRTVIEGSLSNFATVSDDVIKWLQADEDLFRPTNRHASSNGAG